MKSEIDLIKEIQAKGKKLTIIECGCAATLSNHLMTVPGSSGMVGLCLQPYSKESQEGLFGKSNERSVSIGMVEKFAKLYNDSYAASFQLQSEDESVLSHGYVCVKVDNVKTFYHVSLNYNCTGSNDYLSKDENLVENRLELLDRIKKVGVNILYKHLVDENHSLSDLYIDGVFDNEGKFLFKETLKVLSQTKETETLFEIDKDSNWNRFEDFTRNTKGLILLRGSFNPVHERHIELIEKARKLYPDYKVAFLVSLKRFDKTTLKFEECLLKKAQINKLGYSVIFSYHPLFATTLSTIRRRWNLPIIFPVGADTINRFVDDELKHDEEFLNKMLTHAQEFKKETGKNWGAKEGFNIENYKPTIFSTRIFNNSKFLVFKRKGISLSENTKYFEKIIETVEDDDDALGISSTKIRMGQIKSSLGL